jgi:low affinity Fe/Cu permease
MSLNRLFTRFANVVSKWTGRPAAFTLCIIGVAVWAASGPMFKFSETWQLVINTSTTIITFLMVFLIQNTQNRDNAALHAKLDELIRVGDSDNKFIGIEHLTDDELEAILEECERSAREIHEVLHKKRARRGQGGTTAMVEDPGHPLPAPRKASPRTASPRKPAAKRKPA